MNFLKLDLHVHTAFSIDSIIQPRALAKKAKKLGIVFVVADHNSIAVHKELRSLGARFIPGEEIGTDRGDLIALYINELIPKKTGFAEALDRIHEQGGLAYLPHMFDKLRKGVVPENTEIKKVDIIEIFNSRCLDQKYNRQAEEFANKHAIPGAASTDSHFLFEFGGSYSEAPQFDIENPKELLKALSSDSVSYVKRPAPIFVKGTTTLVAIGKKMGRKLIPRK